VELAATVADCALKIRAGAETPQIETISTHPQTYPRNATIAAVFEQIARTNASRPAVTFGPATLNYGELNDRANRLAHRLRRAGVGPDILVGCVAERSADLIVALVAILKAGGGYVPLDPDYPAERISYLLADTRCAALVGPDATLSRLPQRSSLLALPFEDPLDGESEQNPSPQGDASSIAYVMYTSGSTGKPKGVVAENRAVVRLVRGQSYCDFSPNETWLHFAPLAFDASTLEIWGALLNGGRVVVAPQRASLPDLGRLIQSQRITSLWLTTGLFNLMVDQQLEALAGVRQLLAGGDVLSPRHVKHVLEGAPGITVINGYGPTENTTFTCCHRMKPGTPVPIPVPIGAAIAHTTAYILDDQRQPVTPGIVGELYTGGDGVARGYLNNPEATAGKFLPDPFSDVPGARMYRTGDLARGRPDGTIEFIGRVDNQVKILGHRIELGEIETALTEHPAISQCCVIAHTDSTGPKRLIAYFMAKGGELTPNELRTFLSIRLPRYMIPALLVPLCAWPLNANGKIDRAALPKPYAETPTPPAVVPGTSLEAVITAAWHRAVASGSIGLDDNFFDIGGDSLRLISVHAELEQSLGREIPVMDLFEATTIRALIKKLAPKQPIGTGLATPASDRNSSGIENTPLSSHRATSSAPVNRGAGIQSDEARAAKQRAAFAMRRPSK